MRELVDKNSSKNKRSFSRYIFPRMKDGDKDYKSMFPCYYVEKSDEVKECA